MFRFLTVLKSYRLGQYKINFAVETWPGSNYIFQIERGKFITFDIEIKNKWLVKIGLKL
jgi:hypothetical protein